MQRTLRTRDEEIDLQRETIKAEYEQEIRRTNLNWEAQLRKQHERVELMQRSEAKLQKDLATLAERHRISEEAVNKLKAEVKEESNRVRKLELELEDVRSRAGTSVLIEKERNDRLLVEHKRTVESLMIDKANLKRGLLNANESTRKALQEGTRKSESEKAKIRVELESARKTIMEQADKIKNLEKVSIQVYSSEAELLELRKEFKKRIDEEKMTAEKMEMKHASEIRDLKGKAWECERKLASTEGQLAGLNKTLQLTASDVVRLRNEKITAEQRVAELEANLQRKREGDSRELEDMQAQVQLTRGQLEVSRAREKASLERIKKLNDDRLMGQSRVSELQLELDRVRRLLEETKERAAAQKEETRAQLALSDAQKDRALEAEKDALEKAREAKKETERAFRERDNATRERDQVIEGASGLKPFRGIIFEKEGKKWGRKKETKRFTFTDKEDITESENKNELLSPFSDDLGPPPSPLPELPMFTPENSPHASLNFDSNKKRGRKSSVGRLSSSISVKSIVEGTDPQQYLVNLKKECNRLSEENERFRTVIKDMRTEMERIRQLHSPNKSSDPSPLAKSIHATGKETQLVEENTALKSTITQHEVTIQRLRSERAKLIDISNMLKARVHKLQCAPVPQTAFLPRPTSPRSLFVPQYPRNQFRYHPPPSKQYSLPSQPQPDGREKPYLDPVALRDKPSFYTNYTHADIAPSRTNFEERVNSLGAVSSDRTNEVYSHENDHQAVGPRNTEVSGEFQERKNLRRTDSSPVGDRGRNLQINKRQKNLQNIKKKLKIRKENLRRDIEKMVANRLGIKVEANKEKNEDSIGSLDVGGTSVVRSERPKKIESSGKATHSQLQAKEKLAIEMKSRPSMVRNYAVR